MDLISAHVAVEDSGSRVLMAISPGPSVEFQSKASGKKAQVEGKCSLSFVREIELCVTSWFWRDRVKAPFRI